MAATDIRELAQRYVELSCQHDVPAIRLMLDPQATYQSANVGFHSGPQAIGEMMSGFFETYPDVSWEVAEYRSVGEDAVEFEFVLRATHRESGEVIERPGLERIEFTAEGSIRHIEVGAR